MDGRGGISGAAVVAVLAGSVLAYSGLKNKGIASTIRTVIAGNSPDKAASAGLDIGVASGAATGTATGQTKAELAGGGGSVGVGSGIGSAPALTAIAFAQTQIGKPYKFGAAGPDSWDCSGLIMVAYQHAGISLPHSTFAMIAIGKNVTNQTFAPGDLIFPHAAHVQLYIGGGQVIEAFDTGFPVRVASVGHVWQARRVAP